MGKLLVSSSLALAVLPLIASQAVAAGKYDRTKVMRVQKQFRELTMTTQALMKNKPGDQRRAALLIRKAAEGIKKARDPHDIQGALYELRLAMSGSRGNIVNDQQSALMDGLLKDLAGMVDPKELKTIRGRSQEAAAKGNLGAIRSALSIFYGDTNGVYPSDPNTELIPRYLSEIPQIDLLHHQPSQSIRVIKTLKGKDFRKAGADTGRLTYIADPSSPAFGTVFIDCTHKDGRGSTWTGY